MGSSGCPGAKHRHLHSQIPPPYPGAGALPLWLSPALWRGLSILAFIQHAFTVSGADAVMEHVGLTRTDLDRFFRELTSYGALRPLSPSLPQSQPDTREDCGLMEGALSLAVQPPCWVAS